MPFTLAHPAAALPFRRARRLPLDALVIGTMVPDVSLFSRFAPPYWATHSVFMGPPIGIVWGFGVLLLARLARPSTVWLMPAFVRSRVAERAPASPWTASCAALALGIVTHLTWDSFTHKGRMGVRLFHVLSREWIAASPIGALAGYRVLQYASSVLGMLALAFAAYAELRRRPAQRVETTAIVSAVRILIWTLVLVVGPAVSFVYAYHVARRHSWGFRPVLTHVFTGTSLLIFGGVLLAFAAVRTCIAAPARARRGD
jgi:hypothetical protein